MTLIKKIIISTLFIIKISSMPEPYQSIYKLDYRPHGWFLNEVPLKMLIDKYNPKIIVEVGSWLGLSTAFIAQNSDKDAKIYAVDTWLGSEEIKLVMPYNILNDMLPTLYQQFLSNIIHLDLQNKIIPIRMESIEASKALNIKPNLIYIDGAHDENSVYNDIKFWYEKLDINGIMCGDDWDHTSVQQAIYKIIKELNQEVTGVGNFWFLNPKNNNNK